MNDNLNTPSLKSIPVVILARVSLINRQETDRQIYELTKYAASQNYDVVEVIEESISGDACRDKRTGLQQVEGLARRGSIKKVLVHEVSRLSRRNSVAHEFIETLEELKVSLFWYTQRIETLLPNGKRNPASAIMFALLSEMARNERETLRERILSGLAEARRKGKVLGRPIGTTTSAEALLSKHADIVRQLTWGKSVRDTAKICSKGMSTVQRIKKLMKQEGLVA